MKNFLVTLVLSLFLVGVAFSQNPFNDQNGQLKVLLTLPNQTTLGDSTTTITQSFTLPNDYPYTDMSVHPVSYALKTVGTYGAPQTLILIRGMYNGGADSVNFDTLRASTSGQGQTDTTGTVQFTNTVKNKRAEFYKIAVTNTGKAIASGFVELIFEKPQAIPNFNYNK